MSNPRRDLCQFLGSQVTACCPQESMSVQLKKFAKCLFKCLIMNIEVFYAYN